MTDNDAPENPKPNMFSWHKPLDSNQPLQEANVESSSIIEPLDEIPREEHFRLAAKRLALMEEEISQILIKGEDAGLTHVSHMGNNEFQTSSVDENIYQPNGQKAYIGLNIGFSQDGHLFQLPESTNELRISLLSESGLKEQCENYFKENASNTDDESPFNTKYLFTLEGDYKKTIDIPHDFPMSDERKPLEVDEFDEGEDIYESEMTEDDFELAGRALLMLKNRLLGISDEAEAQESNPKKQQP